MVRRRRVIIDWGDGTKKQGSPAPDNYYKNHRGLEDNSQSISKCERCANGSNDCEWGYTEESCDSNYFNYSHIYKCDQQDITSLPICDSTGGNDPCKTADSTACVYKPRVHIRDNWGWCTGVCTGRSGGDEGCYDDVSLKQPSQNDLASECSYQVSGKDDIFQNIDWNNENNPWTYYDGEIVVRTSASELLSQ